jgi:hypothetical protein
VELLGAFLSEIVAFLGYVLLFAAVYKLFQITTELGEIKELLRSQARSGSPLPSPAMAQALAPLTNLSSSDDASDYAEKLLRAVNAESRASAPVSSSSATENL